MSYETWAEWLEANPDAADDEKLATLRRCIFAAAKEAVGQGHINSGWANKKLPGLGVAERVDHSASYVLAAQLTGKAEYRFTARSQAEALQQAQDTIARNRRAIITDIAVVSPPVIVSGPEDVTPGALPDNAPTTVADTLTKLREVVMLAAIAGPHICRDGANELLADFGLDELPPVREFVVTRPTEAVLRTVVTAYDEQTAERVADWRWADGWSGYTVSEVADPGDYQVEQD